MFKSADFQDGLVKNNMDKLTFYALSSPEKLDRIGEYLAARLSRDVDKRRTMYVWQDFFWQFWEGALGPFILGNLGW